MGLDIGSTTVKCVVLDDHNIIFNYYKRHFSDIASASPLWSAKRSQRWQRQSQSIRHRLRRPVSGQMAGFPVRSGGDSRQQRCESLLPQTDVAIELGGEDAKITYFKGSTEQRMNGTCAGGTGAFIDQMASLLKRTQRALCAGCQATHIYDIAARCGVFAKSDIQRLSTKERRGRTSRRRAAGRRQPDQQRPGLRRPIRAGSPFWGGRCTSCPRLKTGHQNAQDNDEDIMDTPYAMMFVAACAR